MKKIFEIKVWIKNLFRKHKICIDICPNCHLKRKGLPLDAEDLSNGKCGVCGGVGLLEMTPIGKFEKNVFKMFKQK